MQEKKVKITPQKEINPICPYCMKELDEIFFKYAWRNFWLADSAFFCPHCRKLLGINRVG